MTSWRGTEQGEFAVVMSRTDRQHASRVGHRICAAVENLAMAHPGSDVSSCVTVSVGVCTSTPATDSNWEELELVAGANKALTLAKKQGRNRIDAVEGQPENPNLE